MSDQDYILEYEAFQNSFKKTEISGEECGEVIMHMAGYFSRYNLKMGEALRMYTVVKANLQGQVDATTGKAMSSAKADTLADATPEAAAYAIAKIHVQNLEQYINALKALQRALISEYNNSNI